MAYNFSLSGIKNAQEEVEQIDNDFKKTAAQIHSTFESIRKTQFEEMNVCNAQISQLNAEMANVEQAISHNLQVKAAAQEKIAKLEAELKKSEAALQQAKKELNSAISQYNSCKPPASTGDAEWDSERRQEYREEKAYLENKMASARNDVNYLEGRIAQIKQEIARLKQIIAKVNQNNPLLSKIKEECNVKKRDVQTHLFKLKETKSNLFEKHDAFNTYYGYAQNTMNATCQRIEQAFSTASMAVNALNRLGSCGGDNVEMDEGALQEIIRILQMYVGKLSDSIKTLMDRKNAFRSKLKDKISERVKQDMERIDYIADKINSNIENITSNLAVAQSYLANYSALG